MKQGVLFTCEHGGNQIPEPWRHVFDGAEEVLESHRGYDPGALDIYSQLTKAIPSRHAHSLVSRLLVELNRSQGHPNLFSEYTKGLTKNQKQNILREHYFPYRDQVYGMIQDMMADGQTVLHISVHTFTPIWHGQTRNADIGLLYDPSRLAEKDFCKQWKHHIINDNPAIRVRMNYPYKGSADGFTTYLRRQFPQGYCGIEIEVNQQLLLKPPQGAYIHTFLSDSLSFLNQQHKTLHT